MAAKADVLNGDHRPNAGRRSLQAAYYFTLAAASLVAALAVPGKMGPTLLAVLVVWVCTSLALRANLRVAGHGLVVAATAVLLLRNHAGLGVEARWWAIVTLLVLLVPFILVPLHRSPGFPFLHAWCLLEGLYVYVSFLVSAPGAAYASTYSPEVRTTGYRVLALFTSLLVGAGVAVLRRSGTAPSRRGATPDANPVPAAAIRRAYALAIGGFLAANASGYLGIVDRIGQLEQFFRVVGFGGGLILAMIWLDRRLTLAHKLPLASATGFLALAGLGSGALYLSAIPGLLLLALWLSYRRNVPWAGLFTALVALIPLNAGKGEFRQVARDPGRTESRTTLGLQWIDSTLDNLSNTGDVGISNSAHRFANSDLLGYVATWAPQRFPYVGYGVYTDLPTLLVPRFLLPDKGTFNISNEFGRRYELIASSDFGTAVNTPLHVEAYIAGGMPALVVIALVGGLFMAWLGRLLSDRSPATILTGVLVTLQVLSTVESGILGFVLVVPFIVVLRPVMRWACLGRASGRHGGETTRSAAAVPVAAIR